MKFLEKVGLVLFSNIVLILSIVVIFLIFGWLDILTIVKLILVIKESEIYTYLFLGGSALCILLAIRCIFFTDPDGADGIEVQGETGKLVITKETLENIVSTVVAGFDGARETVARIDVNEENGVYVSITLNVLPDIVIKELISNIQSKVIEAIKKATDLDVKEVNVKVKSVYEKKIITEESGT